MIRKIAAILFVLNLAALIPLGWLFLRSESFSFFKTELLLICVATLFTTFGMWIFQREARRFQPIHFFCGIALIIAHIYVIGNAGAFVSAGPLLFAISFAYLGFALDAFVNRRIRSSLLFYFFKSLLALECAFFIFRPELPVYYMLAAIVLLIISIFTVTVSFLPADQST